MKRAILLCFLLGFFTDLSEEEKTKLKDMLVLPLISDESNRIVYEILEYEPLLDSSDMSFKDWIKIAKDIEVR